MRTALWTAYFVLCFIAIVVLESLPRFLIETTVPLMIVQRAILLALFLGVAWFFHIALHAQWRWSVLSSMFFVDALVALSLSVLLFLQFYSNVFIVVAAGVVLLRAAIMSYLVSHRLPHLHSVVFFSCLLLYICAELILTLGINPL